MVGLKSKTGVVAFGQTVWFRVNVTVAMGKVKLGHSVAVPLKLKVFVIVAV